MSGPLTPGEFERARTWLFEIARILLPADAAWTGTGNGWRRFDHSGGLSINTHKAVWFRHSDGKDGISPVKLIAVLKPGEDAGQWLAAWLAAHEGTGSCMVVDGDEDDEVDPVSVARCNRILTEMGCAENTIGENYLRGRGLPPPYPDCVRFIGNARNGESALIGILVAHDRIVGVQLTFLTPFGGKSLRPPMRIRLNLEKAQGAVFRIPARPEALARSLDPQGDYATAEGLEDALSIWQLGRPLTVLGLPGISALPHVELPKGARLVHVRDGDEPDSSADQACTRGIDAHLLAGVRVKVAPTAPGEDANQVLLHWGPDILHSLISQAREAPLSFDGRIIRLAQLEGRAFDQERDAIRKIFKVRATTIDSEVKKLGPSPATAKEAADDGSAAGVLSVPEDLPWTESLPPLATLLDTIKTTIERFVVLTQAQAVAVTLWVAAAHLLQSPKVDLEIFPKLAVQSKDPASGKTTLLKLIWNLLPRAKLWTYPSGAFLVRAIEQGSPSLCLDELQYAEDKNLLRVINAAHERALAYVPLLVPDPDGGWIPREFPVWVPMALARLGEFSGAQQSRAIVIWMLPKLRGETREPLRRPEVPELADVRRQLVGWADTVPAWTAPAIPDVLLNRDFNNWEPLLFVAELAGEEWCSDVHQAVREMVKLERAPSVTERLLASIWKIYQPDPDETPTPFIPSTDLKDALIADTEEDWAELNRGKPINFEWLGRQLRHLLEPRGPQQENYYDPVTGKRRNRNGYFFTQFKNAFARYVGEHPLSYTPAEKPSSPSSPSSPVKNPSKNKPHAEEGRPSCEEGEASDPLQAKPSKVNGLDTTEGGEEGEEGLAGESIEEKKDAVSSGVATAQTYPTASGEDREATAPEPNGPMPRPPKRRTHAIPEAIHTARREHPEWSEAQISKHVGRPKSVVHRILNADPTGEAS